MLCMLHPIAFIIICDNTLSDEKISQNQLNIIQLFGAETYNSWIWAFNFYLQNSFAFPTQ